MTNEQILNYFFYRFNDPSFIDLPRDTYMEAIIRRATIVNEWLQTPVGKELLESEITSVDYNFRSTGRYWSYAKDSEELFMKKFVYHDIRLYRLIFYCYHTEKNLMQAIEYLENMSGASYADSFIESQESFLHLIPNLANQSNEDFYFRNAHSEYVYKAILKYEGKMKFISPCYYSDFTYDQRIYSLPPSKYQVFYNYEYLLCFKPRTVILTDSLELAKLNQNILYANGNKDVIWLSWLDASRLPKEMWRQLSGRNIYYLVKGHSGKTAHETYLTAFNVYDNYLKCLESTPVKFVTYVSKSINQHCFKKSPSLLSVEDFLVLQTEPPSNDLFAPLEAIALPCLKVFSPFIYSGTVSIFYGQSGGKTLFTLSLAMAASLNQKLFEQWQAPKETAVHYLHCKSLQTSEAVVTVRKSFPNRLSQFYESNYHYQSFALDSLGRRGGLVMDNITPSSLVVLDGASLSFHDHPSYIAVIDILEQLKALDCAVIWILDHRNQKNIKTIKNELPIDSIVKFTKIKPSQANHIALQLDIEKGFKMKNTDTYRARVQFNPNDDKPSWRLLKSNRSKEEEVKLIQKYYLAGKTGPEIARLMNISESKVKRIRAKIVNTLKITGKYPD